MSNENKMVEDVNSDLSPQYYNPETGRYEYLHGADGVSFTGNHVLTESGLWVPQSGTSDGAVRTQLTGSLMEDEEAIPVDQLTRNFKVMVFDASLQETIPAGENRTWDIYAPDGWIVSEIVDVRMLVDPPAESTDGDHILSFGRTVLTSGASRGDYAISSGSVNSRIIFNGGTGFNTEENDTFPNKPAEILTAYKLLSFDDETPIQAYYRNDFDVEQTNRIFIRLKCIVEKKVG